MNNRNEYKEASVVIYCENHEALLTAVESGKAKRRGTHSDKSGNLYAKAWWDTTIDPNRIVGWIGLAEMKAIHKKLKNYDHKIISLHDGCKWKIGDDLIGLLIRR